MLAQTHVDFQRERLAPHFVYESYDQASKLFYNRGSVGFVFLAWPLVGTNLLAQGEIDDFLKEDDNLPNGSSLQVLMIGWNDIDYHLTNWANKRKGEVFCELAKKRSAFLSKQAKEQGVIKDTILLISVTVPGKPNPHDMDRRMQALKSCFKAIGLYVSEVDDKGLLAECRKIFSSTAFGDDINPYEILSEQILDPDFGLEVQDDIVLKGEDRAFIALEAVSRPSGWRLPLMDLFLGNELRRGEQIKSNYLIHFALVVEQNQAVGKSAQIAKREALQRNIANGMSKWLPDLEREAEDMDSAVSFLQNGDRLVTLHSHIILEDEVSKIKDRVSFTSSMLRRSGFNFKPCKYDHATILLSSLPMQLVEKKPGLYFDKIAGLNEDIKYLGRGIQSVSSEAKVLLPIVGEWKGDLRSPGMLLTGRRGQIMYWSPFGSALIKSSSKAMPLENFNLCVAGTPGSGKSVFMQELMLSTLGVGGKVFVLDYGRSFKRSCMILKGSYIEFDLNDPISINPFSELPEDNSPASIEARADFLSSFPSVLATMAAPRFGVNDLQFPMLSKALITVLQEKGAKTEITDIADWLLRQEESYAKDLGNMLFPFTNKGQHGKFFSGKAKISLNTDIVVIETDHLRSVPELLAVIVQIMIVHINGQMVKGDRNQPFLIVIDEAWKLLAGEASGKFIEDATRIARKYNGSITLATQLLTDYFRKESPAAEKVFENSAHKVILKQNPQGLLAMRANPKLEGFVKEDWQLELLQSVHSNPPHYSEAAIYGPNVQGVISRLKIDPFTLLLTSTNARDYEALEELMSKGMSVTEAINETLKTRGVEI